MQSAHGAGGAVTSNVHNLSSVKLEKGGVASIAANATSNSTGSSKNISGVSQRKNSAHGKNRRMGGTGASQGASQPSD